MSKNKIIISIAGSELVVMTEESREYTTMLANTVDRKIRDLLASSSKVTTPMACILTCLDLCDENEKAKAAATRLRDEIKNYYERNAELEDRVEELEQELAVLRRRNGL
ncbi:MAG: cell division protein ZapA [Clostridia bacterium]|nr:cell division protein ZapA [Clostridia bacterium]